MTVDLAAPTATLLRAERRQSRLATSLVVAVALTASPPLLLGASATAMQVSALPAVLVLVLLAGLAVVASDRRVAALRVIATGEEQLALPTVARARARLLEPARRARLATALHVWAVAGPGWATLHPAVRLPGCLWIDPGTAHELDELAALVASSDPQRAQALACCELLLIEGARPYPGRGSHDGVRDATARIAALLADPQAA